MIFKPQLADKVLRGEKTQTRRPVKPGEDECRYRPGRTYAVQRGRGKPSVARIEILRVEKVTLGSITVGDSKAEGFRTRKGFLSYWAELYGDDVDLEQEVWAIRFRLVDDPLSEEEQLRLERVSLKGAGDQAPGRAMVAFLEAAFREADFWQTYARSLTSAEARAIAHDKLGSLKRPFEPTLQKDDELEAASNLTVVITEVRWVARGGYRVRFKLRDFRVRLPRRVPPAHAEDRSHLDAYGMPPEPTKAEVNAARIEGGQTAAKALAVKGHDVTENLDDDDYKVIKMDSRDRWAEHKQQEKAEEQAREDAKRVAATIRDSLLMMARNGVDSTEYLAGVQKAALAAQEQQEKAA